MARALTLYAGSFAEWTCRVLAQHVAAAWTPLQAVRHAHQPYPPLLSLTLLLLSLPPTTPCCSGRVDMRQVEVTIQNLIGSGMDPKTENNPYLGFIYTSFQERATKISHGNTARHALEFGDEVRAWHARCARAP